MYGTYTWRFNQLWLRTCVPEADIEGRNKYLPPQFLWHVITCPCLWHLLMAHRSTVCLRAVFGKLRIVMHTPEMLPEVEPAWRLLMDKICWVNTEVAMWHSSLLYIVMKKMILDFLDIVATNGIRIPNESLNEVVVSISSWNVNMLVVLVTNMYLKCIFTKLTDFFLFSKNKDTYTFLLDWPVKP